MDELICPNNRPAHEHKTTPPYRIAANERHIMEEIQTQGPVQAIMTVSVRACTTYIFYYVDNAVACT